MGHWESHLVPLLGAALWSSGAAALCSDGRLRLAEPGIQSAIRNPQSAIRNVAVVREKDAPWLVQYAANELVDYLEQMSGVRPPLRTAVAGPSLVLGTYPSPGPSPTRGGEQPLLHSSGLVQGLLPTPPEVLQQSPDAFALRSVGESLVITSAQPLGVLYGVYHYLDALCGVGFFEDGERVPHREAVPLQGVEVDQSPAFALRILGGMWDAWGDFRRTRSTYWSLEEYQAEYGWALKNKVNRLGPMSSRYFPLEEAFRYFGQFVPLYYGPDGGLPLAFSREGVEEVKKEFPHARFTDEEDPNYGGYYLLDVETYSALLQRRLIAARRRFREAHARMGVSLPLGPEGEIAYLRKYLENPREHYAVATIQVAQGLDPEAEIEVDGWGIALTYRNWADFQEHFVASLSDPVRSELLILFNYPHFERFRRDFEYFHGLKWAYCDIDFYGGQDYYFAPTPYSRLLDFAQDVQQHADCHCVGFGLIPELTRVEPMYRQWLFKLAWNPFEFADFDDFLTYWVARRYSPPSQESMLASTRLMAQAFEHFEFRTDPYISSFCPAYRHLSFLGFPCVQAYWDRYGQWEDLQRLEEAVRLALPAAEAEADNPLYHNYLVGLFHAYASELFKFPLVRLHSAYLTATKEFQQGRPESETARQALARFDRSAAEAEATLAAIQSVWSTRPDYRLRDMLADVGQHLELTPALEREIRGRCAAFSNGVYELMALVYRPLFRVLVDDLRQRLQRGEKQVFQGEWAVFETNAINWRDPARRWQEPMISVWNDELLPRFEKITADYFTADLDVIPGAFAGSDVEAVAAAMTDLRERGITAETYADMRTTEMVRANYPLEADL